MSRIAPDCIAAILTETSWMDRLDLTSPSTADRDRAALIIAEKIVARLGPMGAIARSIVISCLCRYELMGQPA